MREYCLFTLAVAFVTLSGCQNPTAPIVSTAKAERIDIDPCITIIRRWGNARITGKLILAVWKDGRVVWSEDLFEGGRPFQCGIIPVERVEQFVATIKSATWFSGGPTLEVNPSHCFTTVYFSQTQSWHIDRYRFDDWLRAGPIVPLSELSKTVGSADFDMDSLAMLDSEGMTISPSEIVGRSMGALIP